MIVGAAMYRMLIDPATPAGPAATRQYLRAVLRQADRLLRRPDAPPLRQERLGAPPERVARAKACRRGQVHLT
ncbi:hypothetical protein [Nonomuraea ceibae]|uniref:hypothetical protein n=1 Tax=Nonomuraea ceibae TaxID=1935170 RepID=UPI001C5DA6AF|nr:hypothetical protein [Nonomuraea ceibae]